jgi:type I restriction enzyme, S subunit
MINKNINWVNTKLKFIVKILGGGTPSTSNNKYYNGMIPWITPKDLSNYNSRYISCGNRNISENGLKQSSAKRLPKGAILFSSRAPIGYVAIAQNEVTTNQGFRNLICGELVNNLFLYYWLKNNVPKIKQLASGSTFKEISGSKLGNIIIELPPLNEQKSIAKILSDLDSKIELLQEQNKTLEKIGQTIFKHWFVDFEFPNKEGKPYKSSGGEMIYNKELKKEIPKDWVVDNYGELLDFKRGIEPGSDNYLSENTENSVLFYRVKDLNSICSVFVDKSLVKDKFCNKNNVLISLDGTVGRLSYGLEGSYSSGIRKVESNEFSNGFIYFLLNSDYIQNIIKKYAKGTTILHANESLKYMYFVNPLNKTYFNLFFENFIQEILFNKDKIENLIKIRDLLLPKLMTGKLRVEF